MKIQRTLLHIAIVFGLLFLASCFTPDGYCTREEISKLIDNDYFIFDKNGGTQIGTGDFWNIDSELIINGDRYYVMPDSTISYMSANFDSTRITGALYISSDSIMHVHVPDSHTIMSLNNGFKIDTIATSWFCISTNYGKPATLSITLEKNTTAECRYINMEVWAGNCSRSITIEQEAGE